jgi:thiamine biosynthesis protein ThiI
MGIIIVRYAELGLKGNNRLFYERRLMKNIKLCLKDNNLGPGSVRRIRGRILLEAGEEAIPFLRNIFGIASLSSTIVAPPNIEDIKKAALEYAATRKFTTFRITSQRLDTRFPLNSSELDRTVGEVIFETLHKKVSLKEPELNLHIEIADKAYLFSDKVLGFGGLPIGTQNRVLCLLDNKYSLLAAALLMRRGCSAALCSLAEFDVEPLKRFCYGMVPSLRIIKSLEEIDKTASESKARALIVSDRVDSLRDYKTKLPVLRPLVGYDDRKLEQEYRRYFSQ